MCGFVNFASSGPLETTDTSGVSLTRQMATVKRQQDVACRDLAPNSTELHKVKDENDELCSSLAAYCDALQMSRPSLTGLMSQYESVFRQLLPTDDVDVERS